MKVGPLNPGCAWMGPTRPCQRAAIALSNPSADAVDAHQQAIELAFVQSPVPDSSPRPPAVDLHLQCLLGSPAAGFSPSTDPMVQEGSVRTVPASVPAPGVEPLRAFLAAVASAATPGLLPLPGEKKLAGVVASQEVIRRTSARLAKDPLNKGTIMQKATDKVARELKFIGSSEQVTEEVLAKLLKLFAGPLSEAVIEALSFLAGVKGKAELQVTHV